MHVSVIVPTFNRAHCIADCIDSVLREKSVSLEIIVVDDGSIDETISILKCYGDAITVIQQENAGVSVARNAGIAISRGKYIKFLDSDDMLIPGSIAWQLAVASKLPNYGICVGLLVGMDNLIDSPIADSDNFTVPSKPRTTYQMASQAIQVSQPLLPRNAIIEVGGFSQSSMAEDFDLFLRIHMGGWHFFDVDIPVTLFNNMSQNGRLSLSSVRDRLSGGMEMYARLVRDAQNWNNEEVESLRLGLGQYLWSFGRRLARNNLDSEASIFFSWAYELAGRRAYNANLLVKLLYSLFSAVSVERWMEKIKRATKF